MPNERIIRDAQDMVKPDVKVPSTSVPEPTNMPEIAMPESVLEVQTKLVKLNEKPVWAAKNPQRPM